MQEVIITQELQQARSAVFGGYRRRRHDRPADPEVLNHAFFRRPSRRHSRRHAKRVIHKRENSAFFITNGKDNDYFQFNFRELLTFDDGLDKRLSDSISSGFYEASERGSISSSCSSNSSISNIVSGRQWGFQVI